MAKRTFKTGSVKIAAVTLNYVRDASYTVEEDQEVDTAIGQSWESVTALVRRWRLDVTADYNPEDPAQLTLITAMTSGATALSAISFYDNASAYFTGSGVITSLNVRKAVGSMDKLVVSFRNQNVAASYT